VVLEANLRLGILSVEALFGACDVFHGTNFLAPPGRRCRTVVTVHDLAFVKYANVIPVPHRYRKYIGASIDRADRVIAVSKATADDVLSLFDVPARKVAVVHEGAPPRRESPPESEFAEARRRLRIPERFFLFVGTLEPRKNLVRLVKAYRAAASCLPDPPGLVLAGRTGWSAGEIHRAIAEAGRVLPVRRLGFVPERLLSSLYEHCLALVLFSLHEGFGLPLVEAFARGAPAVASSAGALPEVAGDAALLVDPLDEAGLANALVRVAREEALREDLSRRGRERAADFTWEKAAAETRGVYEDAVGDGGRHA
jgi:glycosyltransferase involved in cell wall biosynthesis